MLKKICTKCQREKTLDKFGMDRSRPDGRFPWCKDCRKKPSNLIDLTGQSFGKLYVLKEAPKKYDRRAWIVQCECGTKKTVLQQSLISGATASCGCSRKEGLNIVDLTNGTFDQWTVLRITSRRTRSGGVYFECQCSCGDIKEVSSSSLLQGRSKSCGKCRAIKEYCIHDHSIEEWGRTPSGACRACIKEKALIRNYDITLEDYMELWESQGGRCAICGEELTLGLGLQGWNRGTRIEVDHAHVKGPKRKTVRGLLCGGRWAGCNRRLGKVDDPSWLEAALEYISNPPAQQILKEHEREITKTQNRKGSI